MKTEVEIKPMTELAVEPFEQLEIGDYFWSGRIILQKIRGDMAFDITQGICFRFGIRENLPLDHPVRWIKKVLVFESS